MKSSIIYRLLLIILASVGILFFLFKTTKMPNEQKNGFNRTWLTDSLQSLQRKPVDKDLYFINGYTGTNLYLSGINPKAIIALNRNFKLQDTLYLDFKAPEELLAPNTLFVDSPWLYLHINNLKSVISGQFPNKKVTATKLQTEVFIRSAQISPNTLVVRIFNPEKQKQVFQKIDNLTGKVIKEELIIHDQNDAGFSTDGLLKYSATSGRLLYIEYFKNRFFCLDTNLNVIYQGRTIDTTFNNSVEIATKETGEKSGHILPVSARKIVNKNFFMSSKFIYVLSGLKADNESIASFSHNSLLDVYSIESGKYQGSFYVPYLSNSAPRSIIATHDTLTVLYPGHLSTFRIPEITPVAKATAG